MGFFAVWGFMYFVYILRCADQSLYTGLTTDPQRRLSEHQTGKKGARYTRGRRPVVLIWQSEPLRDRSSAAQLEWRLKKMNRQQKEAWIQEHSISLIE